MTRWKESDLPAHVRAQIDGAAPAPIASRKSKYGAVPTVADGIRFASKLEATHYGQLKFLRSSGLIKQFMRQVPIFLSGGVRHVVDWMVICEGREPIFIESKGRDLTASRNKRKQVLAEHGIEIFLWMSPTTFPACLSRFGEE